MAQGLKPMQTAGALMRTNLFAGALKLTRRLGRLAMLVSGPLFACMFSLSACDTAGPTSGAYPWLDTLDAGEGARVGGKQLMALDEGLSRIDRTGDSMLIIAVHGYRSEGYEWVQPLMTLDDDTNEIHFFRWDWGRCPSDAATELDPAINDILSTRPAITRIVLIGHSLGGLVVAEAAYAWQREAPLEAHVVASPLQVIGAGERCPGPSLSARTLPQSVSFGEWRTRQELDGAFKDLEHDPQNVDLSASTVTLLPETYRGRRLGHNWSISWVAETLAGDTPPP